MAMHIPLPRNAIIRSKSGNSMAIITGNATVDIRTSTRYSPCRKVDAGGELAGIEGDNPRRISRVVLIGRVFSGIFVMGMIAMTDTTM